MNHLPELLAMYLIIAAIVCVLFLLFTWDEYEGPYALFTFFKIDPPIWTYPLIRICWVVSTMVLGLCWLFIAVSFFIRWIFVGSE